MIRWVIIAALLLSALPRDARAEGFCSGTHAYAAGKQAGTKQTQPSERLLGETMTAKDCLERCKTYRDSLSQAGKKRYGRIDYACTYNGKSINQSSQTLY